MEAILSPVRENPSTLAIKNAIEENKAPVFVWGAERNVRPLIMEALRDKSRLSLIVTYSDERCDKIYEDYRFYDKDVFIYPAKDVLFYYADVHGNETERKRLEIIKRICDNKKTVVITTIDGLMDKIPPKKEIAKEAVTIKAGDVIDIDEFRLKMNSLGYENVELVEERGQFCVRGGIIDLFPLTEECPYRIELFGDEVDSIRSFDAETQRSIEEVEEFSVYPACELVLTKERLEAGIRLINEDFEKTAKAFKDSNHTEQLKRITAYKNSVVEEIEELNSSMGVDNMVEYFYSETSSFLEYFSENAKLYVDEPDKVASRAKAYAREFGNAMESRIEGGYILPRQADILYSAEILIEMLAKRKTVLFSDLYSSQSSFYEKTQVNFDSKEIMSYNNSFENLITDIADYRKKKFKIVIVSPSATRGKRIASFLNDRDIPAGFTTDKDRLLQDKEVIIFTGVLNSGYVIRESKLAVISESDIFKEAKAKKKKSKPKYAGAKINTLDEITVGDFVVHENYGVGIYMGIRKLEIDGRLKDYINIQYAGNGKLSIPVEQMAVIGKLASKDGPKPKLSKLGGNDWNKTKSRVKAGVDDIAEELIKLYANRQKQKGYAFSEDTVWQREFEEMFPYEETPDQAKAIADTKADMESERIMDRLICGDVGFGKTEVALRAAFKAVQDSRQVAYLVPTTILAQQHYENFVNRMKDFPVNVRMLSRFCTPKEIKETIAGIKDGSVDIVIGTHRLLSKDIEFKKLGLLIIDEEQRFGVKHKEKIKQMKVNVDVLTLTATPIPRTLHMSLVGLRDMSLLEEAPVDRRPIQTFVMEYDREIVKEAINRELDRGGQVYYVYNRVESIDEVAFDLKSMLPDVRLEFAHGKMNEKELEDIMHKFINKEIDVLVATTIIETGLDIPNVNTIIIHDAERFGLSQLYQLRGRVGRSNRSAYAFLMYQKNKVVSEVAEKRLKAISQYTDLGSGYKISMKDLEIRGAGNLLGAAQSGQIEAVGYDLYCKMLNEAIAKLSGEEVVEEFETSIDLPLNAYIPDKYVKNEYLKLDLYKKIASIEDSDDKDMVIEEAQDRFGPLPKEVMRLIRVAEIKALAHKAFITDIRYINDEVVIYIKDGTNIKIENLEKILRRSKGKMRLVKGLRSGLAVRISKIIEDTLLDEVEEYVTIILAKLIGENDNTDGDYI